MEVHNFDVSKRTELAYSLATLVLFGVGIWTLYNGFENSGKFGWWSILYMWVWGINVGIGINRKPNKQEAEELEKYIEHQIQIRMMILLSRGNNT